MSSASKEALPRLLEALDATEPSVAVEPRRLDGGAVRSRRSAEERDRQFHGVFADAADALLILDDDADRSQKHNDDKNKRSRMGIFVFVVDRRRP